jgi:hypothetical protein
VRQAVRRGGRRSVWAAVASCHQIAQLNAAAPTRSASPASHAKLPVRPYAKPSSLQRRTHLIANPSRCGMHLVVGADPLDARHLRLELGLRTEARLYRAKPQTVAIPCQTHRRTGFKGAKVCASHASCSWRACAITHATMHASASPINALAMITRFPALKCDLLWCTRLVCKETVTHLVFNGNFVLLRASCIH